MHRYFKWAQEQFNLFEFRDNDNQFKSVVHNVRPAGQVVMWPAVSNKKWDYFKSRHLVYSLAV